MAKTRDKLDYWCQACRKTANKKWKKNNPERIKALGRKNQSDRYTRLKLEFVAAYGGKCQCCGEEDVHFLTVEHCNGVPEYQKRNGRRIDGLRMLQMIKDEGYPSDYALMCMNCNFALGHYGFCPHQPHDESQRRWI